MFTSIKTSKINKDIVTDLSRKFNLGAENIIARIQINCLKHYHSYVYIDKNIKD